MGDKNFNLENQKSLMSFLVLKILPGLKKIQKTQMWYEKGKKKQDNFGNWGYEIYLQSQETKS